ncbi:hypothetical protein AAC387_Pa04g0479 [Persea americana]
MPFTSGIFNDDDHLHLLPGIDVFISAVDLAKESAVDVMNTVLSAMSGLFGGEAVDVSAFFVGDMESEAFVLRRISAARDLVHWRVVYSWTRWSWAMVD